ncbi:MAG TPA: DegT/DnrJ/EryC1/StrS family aminotransferase [Blastocatellia bacterium]|nr:DegT/DnrJ/EryC1/StrS family aminotransferase [Blastocatellia bacterium]
MATKALVRLAIHMSFEIPLSNPDLNGNEIDYVVDAIKSGWIGVGPYIKKFERQFADLCGTRSAIACANGTVALHLALRAQRLGPGDEVIVPSFTYVATANAVRFCGAEPVFVDVEPTTWCMDPAKIESAITPRTKGIIAVHLYGHPADMDAINKVASIYGLWVVEDAAEAILAEYKGRPVGGLASIATFSFHVTKVFTSGEGGALTFNDETLDAFLRMICSHGMDPDRRFFFPVTGYNYRLTNIAAAMLCAQLERRHEFLKRRTEISQLYMETLAGTPGIGFRPVASWAKLSPWLFSITVDPNEFGLKREELMKVLAENGIDSRPFFIPVHTLPPFRESSTARREVLAETDRICSLGVNLPTYTTITDKQVQSIGRVIKAAAR